MSLSRRDVIKSVMVLGTAAIETRSSRAAEPHLDFPKKPHDRLSITSWPFREFIDLPSSDGKPGKLGRDIRYFVAMAAEKFDIHNVNPLAGHFRSSSPEFISEFRASLEKHGSRVVDLGLAGQRFYDPDASQRQAAVNYGRKWIDIAVELGSPSVRQHIHGARGQKPNVELAALSLGKLAGYGGKKNIVVNLENDDSETEDPFFLVQVIEKVGSPYLRALPDFGNSLLPSGDAEFNARAVRAMFGHVWNMCHVKGGVVDDQGKVHHVDLARMFGIARNIGYRGYYCMEPELPGDPLANAAALISQTMQFLS